MSQDIIPDFSPSHLYTETLILLRGPEGVYGQILAHYPNTESGDPDFTGERNPIFTGQMRLQIVTTQGAGMLPLSFPIPTSDPIEAAHLFKECAKKAIEDYKSEHFRRNLTAPPGVIKS